MLKTRWNALFSFEDIFNMIFTHFYLFFLILSFVAVQRLSQRILGLNLKGSLLFLVVMIFKRHILQMQFKICPILMHKSIRHE